MGKSPGSDAGPGSSKAGRCARRNAKKAAADAKADVYAYWVSECFFSGKELPLSDVLYPQCLAWAVLSQKLITCFKVNAKYVRDSSFPSLHVYSLILYYASTYVYQQLSFDGLV